ncbi:unnamed protein product, partial [Hapterophycus canaliculatus]
CCPLGCNQCGGPGCSSSGAAAGLGSDSCCGGGVKASGKYCDDTGEAPCIIGGDCLFSAPRARSRVPSRLTDNPDDTQPKPAAMASPGSMATGLCAARSAANNAAVRDAPRPVLRPV